MHEDETTLPMVDDGSGGDAVAADGVFSALIPHTVSQPGQMVRWAVTATDSDGYTSQSPVDLGREDKTGFPLYYGTVVEDSSLATALPVMHWFVESPRAADTDAGTPGSLFYAGEFYDNIHVRVRGGTARSWPKKSYKLEFNDGFHFLFHDGVPRVDEINLNATYTDKSYVRGADVRVSK